MTPIHRILITLFILCTVIFGTIALTTPMKDDRKAMNDFLLQEALKQDENWAVRQMVKWGGNHE